MGKSTAATGGGKDVSKRNLLDDLHQKSCQEHPVEKASWFSFATFYWMGDLMNLANKQGLTDADLPNIPYEESCKRNADEFEQLWAREISLADTSSRSRPSFARVAWLYCRSRIYITSMIYITSLLLGFATPTILMKRVMQFAQSTHIDKYDGLMWVTLLVLCEFGRVFFFTLTWAMSYRTAIRLKSACMGLVYRKLLRTGNLNDQMSSKLLNVISGDCSRLYELVVSGQVSIGGPMVMFMCAAYIWYELGWFPMIGLTVFVVAYPLQYFLAKGTGSMKRKAVRVKDERVSLISQAIQHFKFLKMFAWEGFLFKTISDVREKERKYLVKGQLLQSFSIVLGPTLPHIAAIITFLIYISSGNSLHPDQAFCLIAIYNSRLRPTFMRIRAGFRAWFGAKISVSRIQSLLVLPEAKDPNANTCDSNHADIDLALLLEDFTATRRVSQVGQNQRESGKSSSKKTGSFKEEQTKNLNSIEKLMGSSESLAFRLGPINLQIKKGSFIGICGYVGSGKTTFLETIAGSITSDMGVMNVFGRTAYVPQHSWLFKGTIRDNIIFGEPFDSVRYYSCIESCCLINDFAVLPLGDLTKVDNNGTNLSGGQRQRITLARALYYQPGDIFLLDDPLSGLDNRVAKIVFENAINGKLRKLKKTIVFVTHQLNFLKECDEILVFSNGKIKARGTHQQLIAAANDSIYNVLWNSSTQNSTEHETPLLEDCDILDLQMDASAVGHAKKLQLELEKSRKDISAKVYLLYIKSAGGWIAFFTVFIAFAFSASSTAFSSWWLKHWFKTKDIYTRDEGNETEISVTEILMPENHALNGHHPSEEFIDIHSPNFIFSRNVYAAAIGVIFVTSFMQTIFFVLTSMKASKRLHQGILAQFFRSRMRTLEKIGCGQIFNLFGRDVDEVDGSLPNNIENFLQNVFVVLSVLVLVTIIFPTFLLFALVIFVLFSFYRRIYNTAIRDLKRIESSRRSPIFNRISETMKGLGVIRAFNKERLMTEQFEKLTDAACSVSYIFSSSVRWLSIRLDILAVMITGSVAALVFTFHGSVSVAAAGLALAYAAQLSGVFQFTVRLASETEAKFVSVERMHTFLSYEQVEDLECIEETRKRHGTRLEIKPELDMHPNWPTMGHVKFDSVTLAYSTTDAPVLREVTFEVQAGQNIGIIGRTGSGKSSIGNALFRLMELKSGSIWIDGVDISAIPLQKLRNSMCVIPQDPSVFHKSIRFNLDAGKLYRDHELWAVLEKTGLKPHIDNLDSEVGLSHGQKQLLCIARALLRQAKILFVDESTSNMDTETAAVVEKLIAEEFHHSTVFIVAHRTSALASCDNILIMGDGEVRDYGPMDVLSRKPEFKESFEKFESVTFE